MVLEMALDVSKEGASTECAAFVQRSIATRSLLATGDARPAKVGHASFEYAVNSAVCCFGFILICWRRKTSQECLYTKWVKGALRV